ncbi:MAG: tetratricopeptide repeat protein [Woeseiaceae bacterium]|nr:tetratricopeptide repeat protein [Woeseiaceae bacterium]
MSGASPDYEAAVAQLGALLDRRRLAAARDVLGKALPQFPDDVVLLQYAAWIDWMEDRLDAARDTVGKILEIEPGSFDARFLLARIHAEEERYDEAEQVLIELLREFPEAAELYAHYARVMLATFNIDKAERLAAEALKRDPDNESALHVHTLCGFVRSSGAEQLERVHKQLERYPDQMQTTLTVIQLLMGRGRNREAYDLARELVALQPDNEHLVELAQELRYASHWSLLPLWPMQKWGWGGSIAIWIAVVALFRSGVLEGTALEPYTGVLVAVVIGYVIYSWIWPPILRRLLK